MLDNETKVLNGCLDRLWSQADPNLNPYSPLSRHVSWDESCNNPSHPSTPDIPSLRSLVTKWGTPDNVTSKWCPIHGKAEVNWWPYILAIISHVSHVRKLVSNRLSSNNSAKTTNRERTVFSTNRARKMGYWDPTE